MKWHKTKFGKVNNDITEKPVANNVKKKIGLIVLKQRLGRIYEVAKSFDLAFRK